MKAAQVVALLGLASLSYAQAPSPTESIGCEPHGDHWHCEGPRPTSAAVSSSVSSAADPGPSPTESVGCQPHGDHWHCEGPATSAAATTSASEDHDHDHSSTVDPGPSPTESVGCQPHGDHWHCEGPAVTSGAPSSALSNAPSSSAAAVTTTSADHDDHSQGSATPTKPSPTESVGCEPHGDHWHCDGPRVTSSGLTSVVSNIPTPSSNGTITTTVPTAMAAGLSTTSFGVVALAGTFAVLLAI